MIILLSALNPLKISLMVLQQIPQKFHLPLAFVAGIALTVGMMTGLSNLEGQALQTSVQQKSVSSVRQAEQPVTPKRKSAAPKQAVKLPTSWECRENDDCPGTTTVCNTSHKCERLQDPTCTCSQVNVLECKDKHNRARHTYCQNGCGQQYSANTKQLEPGCIVQ